MELPSTPDQFFSIFAEYNEAFCLWGGIGGLAAVLLEVRTDYVLLAGAVLLFVALVLRSPTGR